MSIKKKILLVDDDLDLLEQSGGTMTFNKTTCRLPARRTRLKSYFFQNFTFVLLRPTSDVDDV